MSVYRENGYLDRADYLKNLAEEYDVPLHVVKTLAQVLGSSEDFDGLVAAVEDEAMRRESM